MKMQQGYCIIFNKSLFTMFKSADKLSL